jgi:hypothetical protein
MAKDSKTDGREEAPRQRVPFSGRRQKLQLSEQDSKSLDKSGWKPRWVNDKDGRIQQALAGGYVFVSPEEAPSIGQFSLTKGNDDLNGKVSLIVSKGESIINLEQSLDAGQPGGNVVENQYVPKGHVNKI